MVCTFTTGISVGSWIVVSPSITARYFQIRTKEASAPVLTHAPGPTPPDVSGVEPASISLGYGPFHI